MSQPTIARRFLAEHFETTRRHFIRLGAAGLVAARAIPINAADTEFSLDGDDAFREAVAELETWLTEPDAFRDVSRGNPKPHSLSDDERASAGLTRDTWKLEVISDPEHPSELETPLTKEAGTALDFAQLMELAESRSTRFAKVMTCLNIGCPLGMGIWEGVPLRDVLWLTRPQKDLRRVFYYGYHNHDEKQMFRSSLPIGRVLEDVSGLPPVILCYKLNGQWLSAERGGPVRVVVPEAYGFKSVKWLTHLVLSNLSHANDTYAEKNNDVDSDLKTFCATLTVPGSVKSGVPFPVTGWAQSGISGLKQVQVWLQDKSEPWSKSDPYFLNAPWREATILDAPEHPGGGMPQMELLRGAHGFDPKTGRPENWPMRLAKAHWAFLCNGRPPGEYVLRCRTIDENGAAQPLPRPFRKSGHAAIESRRITVTD